MPKDYYGLEINQYPERIFGIGCARVFDSWCEDCLACCKGKYQECLKTVLQQTPYYVCEDGNMGRMKKRKGLAENRASKIIKDLEEGKLYMK